MLSSQTATVLIRRIQVLHLARVMQDEIPEVEEAVRVDNYWQPIMQYKDKVFNETKWCFVDANFFKIFSTSFIYGDPNMALAQPYTVVLTETTCKTLFWK